MGRVPRAAAVRAAGGSGWAPAVAEATVRSVLKLGVLAGLLMAAGNWLMPFVLPGIFTADVAVDGGTWGRAQTIVALVPHVATALALRPATRTKMIILLSGQPSVSVPINLLE